MTAFHFDAKVISRKTASSSAKTMALYLAREDPDRATQHALYLVRDQARGADLVASGFGGLPGWAPEPITFFAAVDRYERANATLARAYEVSLPRELSDTGRLELTQDIAATLFADVPHTWSIHAPTSQADGQPNYHAHFLMSERGDDGIARTPQQYFTRAAPEGQDPALGGVRKDRSWQGPGRLREMRQAICTLVNAALERENVPAAVHPASLKDRGFTRETEQELSGRQRWAMREGRDVPAWDAALTRRAQLQEPWGAHVCENTANLTTWHTQKVEDGIPDVRRETITVHVHNRFWGTGDAFLAQTHAVSVEPEPEPEPEPAPTPTPSNETARADPEPAPQTPAPDPVPEPVPWYRRVEQWLVRHVVPTWLTYTEPEPAPQAQAQTPTPAVQPQRQDQAPTRAVSQQTQARAPTREPPQRQVWTSVEEELADLARRLDTLGEEDGSGHGHGRVRLWGTEDAQQRQRRERGGMEW